jgi:hypothetical protein
MVMAVIMAVLMVMVEEEKGLAAAITETQRIVVETRVENAVAILVTRVAVLVGTEQWTEHKRVGTAVAVLLVGTEKVIERMIVVAVETERAGIEIVIETDDETTMNERVATEIETANDDVTVIVKSDVVTMTTKVETKVMINGANEKNALETRRVGRPNDSNRRPTTIRKNTAVIVAVHNCG